MGSLIAVLNSNVMNFLYNIYILPGRPDGVPEKTAVTSHSCSESCRASIGLATEVDVKARTAARADLVNCMLCKLFWGRFGSDRRCKG